MSKPSQETVRRAGLIAVAAALAAFSARHVRRVGRDLVGAGRRRCAHDQGYTCECGAEYRVTGTDRHRVYWPSDAAENAPVLGDLCPRCERPLPHGRAISDLSVSR